MNVLITLTPFDKNIYLCLNNVLYVRFDMIDFDRNCALNDVSFKYNSHFIYVNINSWTFFLSSLGDNCMEKPLSTLWRNYTQNNKPDVLMRLRVSPSGLKASTRQHGLTEYWAHRITFCSAPKNYPRVFCWIYRHEGRKLKHELRCHAVICSKESIATDICNILKVRR